MVGYKVRINIGYRKNDVGTVIWSNDDNLVCKVSFEDGEFYGYDHNDLTILYAI